MPLIKQSSQAVELTLEWLDKNAPDFVTETVHSLFNALHNHCEVNNLQSQLNQQYSDFLSHMIEQYFPDDADEHQVDDISGRLVAIEKTSSCINNHVS